MVVIEEQNYLEHYGILRKSGRYPWGSGGTTEQRSKSFLDYVDDLKRRLGWSDVEIARSLSDENHRFSTTDLRAARVIAKNEQRAAQRAQAMSLQERGFSNVAAAKRMGIPESSYRALIAPGNQEKQDALITTRDMLKAEIADKKYLDYGSGTENHMGVSEERLKIATAMLIDEGYTRHYIKVPQPGNKETTLRVLAAPGVTSKEVYANRDQIRSVSKFSEDNGRTFLGLAKPLPVDPKRVAINYKEDGGAEADGVIYVRPGVPDVSLGGARYAQVRVQVGDDHYLKGMAIYKDDLPEGVDLVFNTPKSSTGNKLDALKPLERDADGKVDPDNPFGSYIRRQIVEKDADGKERAISAMNLVNEEGSWGGGSINPKTGEPYVGWSRSIASQVLSKQSPSLAKERLETTFGRRQREYDEIMALTNPVVRKKLLEEFADGTDAAAVHLKAAALPNQRWQVILPVNSLKDTEIYAPNFKPGEQVALIRYPHGGTFEIPVLTVNNRHAAAKKLLGDAKDVVGINAKVAERLSGADFDGDTVLVIPNNSRKIKDSPALKGLQGFDPLSSYPAYPGMKRISETRKQREMGDVSNLITDMTIKNASHSEIARAVRHSMVVIDSEKKNLNYKLSAEREGIAALKAKYQGGPRAGASTLISRAGSDVRVPARTPRRASKGGPVDPVTGKRVYEYTGETYVNKSGKLVTKTTKSQRLAEVDDAHILSSGTPIERIYADHSNKLKDMANKARLDALNTPRSTYSASAARVYANETATLNSKLALAVRNRPLEREALVRADALVRMKRDANPNMDSDTLKKIKTQAIEQARIQTGARRYQIEITPREWEAIQAGAISSSKLSAILTSANMDTVRALATPRPKLLMTPALNQRAKVMLARGFTRAEVAEQLGVSVSTLDSSIAGD